MIKGNWSNESGGIAGNGLIMYKAHLYHKKCSGNWWSSCGHFYFTHKPKTTNKVPKCKSCLRSLAKGIKRNEQLLA